MNAVEMIEVIRLDSDAALLESHCVDFPQNGSRYEVFSVEIVGWILGKRLITQIRAEMGGLIVARTSDFVSRPDVARAFPKNPVAEKCGFRMDVNVIGFPTEFELLIKAEFADGNAVNFARLRGKRSLSQTGAESACQPLMITTLGRTGSTWLTHLLGSHPEIITYRPFKSEPRVLTYWARILLTLGDRKSYLQMLAADLSDEFWWLGRTALPLNLQEVEPVLLQEIGGGAIEELAMFCRERIGSFYRRVAELQGKSARFFSEKVSPDLTPVAVLNLYPNAREIILVRDFRDMLCSIIAYSARLGYEAFGTTGFGNRANYVWKLRTDVLLLLDAWRSRCAGAHLVRYEDLIQEPEKTMTELFQHLQVAHQPTDVQEFFARAAVEVSGSARHRTATSSSDSLGRWRRELDPSLQAVCREAFGDLLNEFGYPLD